MAATSGPHIPTEISIDISSISLPFVPCAVRIHGIGEKGDIPKFDLHSVRANGNLPTARTQPWQR
jgi:hypothetical protein